MIFFFSVWFTLLNMMISVSIHIAANVINSFFLWLNNIPLCIYTTSSLYTPPFMDIQVFFCVLVITYSAAVNSVFFQVMVSSGQMPRSRIGGSNDNFILFFGGISMLFSILGVPIYTLTNSKIGFLFLHTLSCTYCLQTF